MLLQIAHEGDARAIFEFVAARPPVDHPDFALQKTWQSQSRGDRARICRSLRH